MPYNQSNSGNGNTNFISSVNGLYAAILRDEQGFDPGIAHFTGFFDDFGGDVLADQWSGAAGADAQAVAPAIVAGGLDGICRLTSGDAGDGTANDASVLTRALNYKASSGGLYMRARVKINTAVTNVCVNIGFTDVLATTTLEMPITISGTTLTTNATDAAVFVFDTAQTNDLWHCQGVKNNSDTAISNSGTAPTADTYQIFEIFIDSSGNATFYIDGVLKGSVANAVTASVSLTPVIAVEARTTTSKVVDIDYIEVRAKRAA